MTSVAREEFSTASTLLDLLEKRTVEDPNYWDFKLTPIRAGGHGFFQYPAMMVPELQGALLDDLAAADPAARLIYDPFMGSGTVMLESLYKGFDFHGSDINPMAILLSKVKSNPPTGSSANDAVAAVVSRASEDSSEEDLAFENRDKWFTPAVTRELSQIRRAIQRERDVSIRQFLWVCLAETVRLVSNSRTSTFKLHVYAPDVLSERRPEALVMFTTVGKANAVRASEHWSRMEKRETRDDLTEPKATLLRGGVADPWGAPKKADALMTSPPYGDNKTTVPYGQHSYLPLRWIDHRDLVGSFNEDFLTKIARIDSLSLGGSLVKADSHRNGLEQKTASLGSFLPKLDNRPQLRRKVLAFTQDYSVALQRSSERLRDGAFSFWTLGERRVGQEQMPLVAVTREILESLGHDEVTTIERRLPLGRKRMAGRNSEGATMITEQVLVMQKRTPSE